jgi:hypothetical protein
MSEIFEGMWFPIAGDHHFHSEVDIAYAKSPLCSGRDADARWAPKGYAGPPPRAGASPRFVLYAVNPSKAGAVTETFPRSLEAMPRLLPTATLMWFEAVDGR